ncbi:glycine zipper domain-containing protein [Tropicibacter sp. S64]|uniref:glycine zipper domain-containing protein n=1 Tax=Tropicibacter sp. S64 TaxID=3415122 RepID=UPI003C7AB50E
MANARIEELEREAETQRSRVSDIAHRLKDSANPVRAGQEAIRTSADWAQEAASSLGEMAKKNPAALALIGTGAALLIAQSTRAPQPEQPQPQPDPLRSGPSSRSLELSLDRGLEKLPESARRRVIAAREHALDAQRKLERHAARLGETATRTHQEHPFTTAAIAIGVGAIAGALLPSTKQEGALLGARRDAALRKAEALLHEEIDALQARASAALKDGVEATRSNV